MKRLALLVLVVASPFAFFQVSAGCAGQSEGQLCSPLNGDLDCATGLVCQSLSGGTTGTNGVCCQVNSTHPACLSLGTTSGTTTTGTTTITTTTSSTTSDTGTGGTGGSGTGGSGNGGSNPDAGDGG